MLTHTLTHTGKGTDGTNGHDSAAYYGPVEPTGPEKAKKQPINGFQSVGKDEGGSSNLPSSSTRNPGTNVPGFFVCLENMQRTGLFVRCAFFYAGQGNMTLTQVCGIIKMTRGG